MAWLPFLKREGSSSKSSYRPMFSKRTASSSRGFVGSLRYTYATLYTAVSRLQTSCDPKVTFARLKAHSWSYRDLIYVFHALLWAFWVSIMKVPPFPFNLGIPILYIIAIILPITSQLLFPALPVLTWVITFFSSPFIPVSYRPPISVSLLPTLESVLYGANISDILTRFTHPLLDIPAWLSYGVIHFVGPFVIAAFLWLFAARGALKYWCNAFGYLSLTAVIVQILLPCAPPWYELRNGLTPADYSMKGSPGGLARIDALFHSNGYNTTFSNAPVVFGAFPSLHAGDATMAALFISHFWPGLKLYAWGYTGILYWATMYLTHHYLIDVVGGACLATLFFYLFMPASLRFPDNSTNTNFHPVGGANGSARNKYEEYELDLERNGTSSPNNAYRPASPGADSLSDNEGPPNPLAPYSHTRRPSSPFFYPASPRTAGNPVAGKGIGRNHRHTASIASLIRSEDRVEDGWSPVGNRSFVFPPPSSAQPTPPAVPGSRVAQGGSDAAPTAMSSNALRPGTTTVEGSGMGGVDGAGIVRSRSPSWPDKKDSL